MGEMPRLLPFNQLSLLGYLLLYIISQEIRDSPRYRDSRIPRLPRSHYMVSAPLWRNQFRPTGCWGEWRSV